MNLILASHSPRRRALLSGAGIGFTVQSAEVDESRRVSEAAADYVERMARLKALAVAPAVEEGTIVLGADTVVVAAGQVLGKPGNAADAARMLRLLSGGTHYVVTGVCIVRAPEKVVAVEHESTIVVFKPLSEEAIQTYVATGEPLDKAGAYGIQG
ncbi:MAG: septum formation protein Maf, partial [Acidobacteriota bacterium]|nr:septum formation protein Maf [Acidobacteriota bacterium]